MKNIFVEFALYFVHIWLFNVVFAFLMSQLTWKALTCVWLCGICNLNVKFGFTSVHIWLANPVLQFT